MTKEEILKILEDSSQSLMFHFDLNDTDYFTKHFLSLSDDLDKLTNFDLSKYEKYAYVDDLSLTQPLKRLRKDEPEMVEHPEEYFKNAVDFSEGMVVVKHEK